ncbi:MAG TPA: SDR family NAD(P)-dependent oxidoreductase [Bryobacteraceae bacterium]|jgi:short-subunit dehydrogenase|nr:SDR family NAD(P)-dependent oxidoreductase [Bryobacteraceae bacterium]
MATSSNRSHSSRSFAVVTGASSGIGYELAKQFAQNGFDLLIAADGDGIHQAARDLEALGAQVEPVQVNLAEHDGTHQLLAAIRGAGREVDAIALNAGVGVSGRFIETDLEDEMNMVRLNVLAVLHIAKYVIKDMVARGRGRVLITSSIAGTMPTPYLAVYGATKAFERSLSQSLREELKDTGVTITALMPGATETNFFHRADAEDTKLGASEKDDPAEVAKDGFEALMAGKDHVVAGSFKNKLQAAAGYALPDPLIAKAHAAMAEPGSANKK